MSPTPLVFKYNHGSVTDLGGSAVSPTPSNIYIEYGDPVPVTMLFDINNDDFGSNKIIESRIVDYNIKNFYMTDSISRSSITMSNCSKEILNKVA